MDNILLVDGSVDDSAFLVLPKSHEDVHNSDYPYSRSELIVPLYLRRLWVQKRGCELSVPLGEQEYKGTGDPGEVHHPRIRSSTGKTRQRHDDALSSNSRPDPRFDRRLFWVLDGNGFEYVDDSIWKQSCDDSEKTDKWTNNTSVYDL